MIDSNNSQKSSDNLYKQVDPNIKNLQFNNNKDLDNENNEYGKDMVYGNRNKIETSIEHTKTEDMYSDI
jgi:hypothetical protein